MFNLCKQYDLRVFIIHDRWDSKAYKNRSIDEIKDLYYKVVGILERLKQPGYSNSKELFVLRDIEHEQKRREQLEKLFNRTKEQVMEEQYLLEELKR